MHQHRLREIPARLPQPVMIPKKDLQLLAFAGIDPELRHELMLRDLRQLLHGTRAEDLDEERVLGVRIADTDLLGRRIRDVHHAANALAGYEVGAVQLQVDHDLACLRLRGDRDQGTGNREQEARQNRQLPNI